MKRIYFLSVCLIILILQACGKPQLISEKNYKENDYTIVTADNNLRFNLSDVYDLLSKSDYLRKGGVLDTIEIRKFVDSILVDTLAGFEAWEVDLPEDYNQYRMFKLRYHDLLIKAYLKQAVYDKVVMDSAAISEFYYNSPEVFSVPEQVEISHIAITSYALTNGPDSIKMRKLSEEELKVATKKYADSVRAMIDTPEKFSEIATEYSEDQVNAQNGGYIGWTKKEVHQHPFDSIAFSMKAGEISEPYEDVNGWHIILVSDYFEGGIPELNPNLFKVAEKSYSNKQSNEIGNKLFDSLFADIQMEYNDSLIMDTNLYLVEGQEWAAIVNGQDTIDVNESRSLELSFRNKFGVNNTNNEQKKEMLTLGAQKYVVIQNARASGVEEDSVLSRQRQDLWHKAAKTVIKPGIYDVYWKPEETAVKEYYEKHLDEFKVEKPLKVQHIIVQDSLFGEFIRSQALAGIDFMELAKEHYPGDESIRESLADLGYIGKNDVSPEFFEAASFLQVGDVSAPVKTQFGYHVIKLIEKKSTDGYSSAQGIIRQRLKKEHIENSFEAYKTKVYEKYHVSFVGKLKPLHFKPKELRN